MTDLEEVPTTERIYVGIIGSRKFPDLNMVREFVNGLDRNKHVIISGGANGVDSIAVDHAKFRGIDYKEYKPDYETYGKYKAPHVRNDEIINASDYIIAFWDGSSRGTKSVIDKAEKTGKLYAVYEPLYGEPDKTEYITRLRHSAASLTRPTT